MRVRVRARCALRCISARFSSIHLPMLARFIGTRSQSAHSSHVRPGRVWSHRTEHRYYLYCAMCGECFECALRLSFLSTTLFSLLAHHLQWPRCTCGFHSMPCSLENRQQNETRRPTSSACSRTSQSGSLPCTRDAHTPNATKRGGVFSRHVNAINCTTIEWFLAWLPMCVFVVNFLCAH